MVAPPCDQRCACGRRRNAGDPAHSVCACSLPGAPYPFRGGEHARRAVRYHRAHPHRRARAIDRQDLHRREPRRRRRQHRHGLCGRRRAGRLHHPARDQRLFGQLRALQQAALRSLQGLRRRVRACLVAEHVRGAIRDAGQDHQGIRRAREGQSGEIQRRDPAGRNCAAHPGRGAEGSREHAEARDHRLQGRRRCTAGVAWRHRAAFLGFAAAGPSAHQGRHAALPCGDRRSALARPARRADHGAGRLQGLRVRDRHRAARAGEDAA